MIAFLKNCLKLTIENSDRWARHLFIVATHFYRAHLKWMWVGDCKFYPTCSEYALECFNHHHFFKALGLTVHRILRCHPLATGGYDPAVKEPK